MAWALVQSTSFPWAVSGGSKISSKQSGNTKRAVIKVMCSLQTRPMRVRTFSGLRGGVNSLCNMVNRSHDFHSTVAAATSEKASPILPKGDMFETFTDKANEVIELAQKETRRAGYEFVGPEMILLGLIGNDIDRIFGESADIAAKVLYSMDIYLEDARSEVEGIFGFWRISQPVEIPFTTRALRVFQLSLAEAQQLGHNYIGSEHLLLGLLREDGVANYVLRNLGAYSIDIRTQVMRMIKENAADVVGDGSSGNEMPTLDLEEDGLNLTELADEKKLHPVVQGLDQRIADFVGDGSSGNEMPTLEEDGLNLTELAYEKKLHPVVGRKPLINTVIQILGRLSKNNPCLVGEAGVGKTSIVQGLAQRIADSDVPDFLSNKKVITLDRCLLDRCLLVKGGLKKLMEEIKESNEIILFINDFDTLETEGAIDAANILMPAVARGEVQCVVATTPDEYLKHMKKYPALERLFHPIKVPEATVDETIEILKGFRERYENDYKISYTDEALVAAAHISDQKMSRTWLPGKAIFLCHIAAFFLINAAGSSVSRKEEKVGLTYPNLQTNLMLASENRLMTTLGAFRDKDLEQASVVSDQEMGYKITVTKADIEDTILDLHAIMNLFKGYDCSYQEI